MTRQEIKEMYAPFIRELVNSNSIFDTVDKAIDHIEHQLLMHDRNARIIKIMEFQMAALGVTASDNEQLTMMV